MRVVIAVVILAVSIPLNGCCRPPQQAAYAKPNRSSWDSPQARPRRPDLIKASSVRPPQPISKPRQITKASSVKPPQPVSSVPESTKASSVKPPQPVSSAPESTKASSAEPSAPLPQRKPERPSIDSREGSNTVDQEREAKFKAAEAKAKREGVDSLTGEDIEGLSPEQLKELRGY